MTKLITSLTTLLLFSLQTLISNASYSIPNQQWNKKKRRRTKENNNHVNYCTLTRHWHLSVGPDPSSSMIVSFSSHPNCAKPSTPVGAVLIGTNPTKPDRVILEQGDARMYNASYPSKKKSLYTSDYYHHVIVEDLEPNTKYYYHCVTVPETIVENAVEDDIEDSARQRQLLQSEPAHNYRYKEEIDWRSKIASELAETRNRYLKTEKKQQEQTPPSFTTAPPPGPNTPVKFAIIADLGERPHSYETVAYLDTHSSNLNAILLVGDIAYTQKDHRVWDKWFDMLDATSFASSIPLQVATGNHDIEWNGDTGEIFVAYENRFLMPQVQPAVIEVVREEVDKSLVQYPLPYDFGNAYYSFTYGPARHIVLSSYSHFDPGSAQYTWFLDQLNEVDRSVTPWVFVSLHCPVYNTFRLHRKEPQLLHARRYLEPLFVQYNVNMVFTGHVHAYMRTKPVIYEEVNEAGPIYVIVGNGGRQANAPYHKNEPEDWVLKRDHAEFGYGVLDIINATHAKWEWEQTGFNAPDEVGQLGRNDPIEGQYDRGYIQNQYFLKNGGK